MSKQLDNTQILHLLHNNMYPEELVSSSYQYIIWKVLSRRERDILFQKVEGKTDEEISKMLKLTPQAIQRYVYNIRSKYRNHLDTRVDNKNWFWKKFGKITPVTLQIIVLLVLAGLLLLSPLIIQVCRIPIIRTGSFCTFHNK